MILVGNGSAGGATEVLRGHPRRSHPDEHIGPFRLASGFVVLLRVRGDVELVFLFLSSVLV